ncbi:DUF2789 domain-containing protein [Ketobacter sp.]|uniref:DUF2789 domain-containing protein n=1 Tax=Ketobacter sp. TaxID=2083498 RepID=UPI000C44407C|nr:DUF2789 domain-containing protein [Ketobacter sp.]MBA53721.1 hypothetical protein [Pseudomonadales bacterium]MEE2731289.1 DUF2789 domain-containing protein [Pseudomonadota bacterium]RLT94429.1 MAG: DUF2789 domain-containing protein [Ketobacter sp.]RLU03640.1 MAG: DUF2789 domain-containing protein [Ketobacter sp.]
MDSVYYSMCNLFKQLGLPNEPENIDEFISRHRALSDGVRIEQAPFWSDSQAQFLKSAIEEDSEWCEAVDQLDARLRY